MITSNHFCKMVILTFEYFHRDNCKLQFVILQYCKSKAENCHQLSATKGPSHQHISCDYSWNSACDTEISQAFNSGQLWTLFWPASRLIFLQHVTWPGLYSRLFLRWNSLWCVPCEIVFDVFKGALWNTVFIKVYLSFWSII